MTDWEGLRDAWRAAHDAECDCGCWSAPVRVADEGRKPAKRPRKQPKPDPFDPLLSQNPQ